MPESIGFRVQERAEKPVRARWWLPAVLGLTLLGGAARFTGLGDRDFWFDESCTFLYVHHLFDWPEDSNLLAESTNLPYYALLRGWVSLFGASEASYRSMSALAATLTILLLAMLAWRIGGPVAGMVCAALVAFHPLHIYYAHEARAYALWVLLLSGALFLLFVASRRGRWVWWAGFGVVLLGCLHLHYFTVYWVPATVVCVWLAENRGRAFRQWLTTTALVGVGFAPYFLTAVLPAARGGGGAWIADSWEPLKVIPRTLWAFMPAGAYPAHLRGLSVESPDTVVLGPEWLTAVARGLPAIIMLAVLLFLVRRVLRGPGAHSTAESTWSSHLFAGGLTLIPLILAWLYSIIVTPHYLPGRYDMVAWPGCMIWLGLAVSSFARQVSSRRVGLVAAVVCAPMLVCAALPIGRMASLKPGPTFHRVRALRLAQLAGPDDLVIAFSYDRDYLQYYLYRAGFAGSIVSYPSWLDRQVGWVDTKMDLESPLLPKDAAERLELVSATLRCGGRVWLLTDFLELIGGDTRSEINDYFLRAMDGARYQVTLVDQDFSILELQARRE